MEIYVHLHFPEVHNNPAGVRLLSKKTDFCVVYNLWFIGFYVKKGLLVFIFLLIYFLALYTSYWKAQPISLTNTNSLSQTFAQATRSLHPYQNRCYIGVVVN